MSNMLTEGQSEGVLWGLCGESTGQAGAQPG